MAVASPPTSAVTTTTTPGSSSCGDDGDLEMGPELVHGGGEGDRMEMEMEMVKYPVVIPTPPEKKTMDYPQGSQTGAGFQYGSKTGVVHISTTTKMVYLTSTVDAVYKSTTTRIVYLTSTVDMVATKVPFSGKPSTLVVEEEEEDIYSTPTPSEVLPVGVNYSAVSSRGAPHKSVEKSPAVPYPVETAPSAPHHPLPTVGPIMEPTHDPPCETGPVAVETAPQPSGTLPGQEKTALPIEQPSSYPSESSSAPVDSRIPVATLTRGSGDAPFYMQTPASFGETTSKPSAAVLTTAKLDPLTAPVLPFKPSSIESYPLPTGNHTTRVPLLSSPTRDPSRNITATPVASQKAKESSGSTSATGYPSSSSSPPSVTTPAKTHSSARESGTSRSYISTTLVTTTTTTGNNPAKITPVPPVPSYRPSSIPDAPQIELPTAIMSDDSLDVDQFGDYVATELGGTSAAATGSGTPNSVACLECAEAMGSGSAGGFGMRMSGASLWAVTAMISFGGLVML